ncbi:MAG: hypothetical protein JO257_10365 [Deltaproteobacteria bacterium]|nr:hypothetical protein [Deltaproteobacteria bacterium]
MLVGCDPLAGSDYVGQPLITVHGTFAATGAPTAPLGGVALLWQDANGPGGPGVAATTVPVSLEFPAAFELAVPTPPPVEARFTVDGVQLAEAYIYVVGDLGAPRKTTRGTDRTHVLVWASGDVADGSRAAEYLGGPVTAGYHLRRFEPTHDVGIAQQTLIDRCAQSGAIRSACVTRRSYQLRAVDDADPLRIVVGHP